MPELHVCSFRKISIDKSKVHWLEHRGHTHSWADGPPLPGSWISPKLPEANPAQPIMDAHFASSSQQVARRRRHFQEPQEAKKKQGSHLKSRPPPTAADRFPFSQWRASSPLSSGRPSARPRAPPPALRHRAVLSPSQPAVGATPFKWYALPFPCRKIDPRGAIEPPIKPQSRTHTLHGQDC